MVHCGSDASDVLCDSCRHAAFAATPRYGAGLCVTADRAPDRAADRARGADGGAPNDAVRRFDRISHWVTVIGLVLTAALVIAGFASGTFRSVGAVRDFLGHFGVWAPLAFTGIQAIQCVFPVIPGGAGVVAGPILFGPVVGTICNYVGQCIGSIAAFLISRRLGRALVESRMRSARSRKYLAWLDHPHYPRWFAAAIALPVAPDDLLCYLTGLTDMRVRTFVLIIVLCKPWSVAAYSFGIIAILNHLFPGTGF